MSIDYEEASVLAMIEKWGVDATEPANTTPRPKKWGRAAAGLSV
jgi:hypothetical protein